MIEASFSDLLVWRRELTGAKAPSTIPPSSSRPNPCLVSDLLVSSILQGFAVAHDPATGKQVWRRELGEFGDASVYAAGGNLYAQSDTTLYALAPSTGEVRWQFTPIRDQVETVYSSPIAHGRRLFLGDRHGFLHCLETETGRPVWNVQALPTAGATRRRRAHKAQINCTPAVHGETVIVSLAHRSGKALAYHCKTGEQVWTADLGGPTAGELLIVDESVLVDVENVVFRLDPETGAVRDRYVWQTSRVHGMCSDGSRFAVVVDGDSPETSRLHFGPPSRASSLKIPCQLPRCQWSHRTGCVYVTSKHSIVVADPDRRQLHSVIRYDLDATDRFPVLGGIADADRDRIYVLSDVGALYALRHP